MAPDLDADDIIEAKILKKNIPADDLLSGRESSGFFLNERELVNITPERSLIDGWIRQ